MSSPETPAGSAPTHPSPRGLLVGHYALLALLTSGLVVGAKLIITGELGTLLPNLEGWKLVFPIGGWLGAALSVYGLWRWRWWGFVLGLWVAAFELAVELYGGGLGWHLLRLPVAAGLLVWFCSALRGRFA